MKELVQFEGMVFQYISKLFQSYHLLRKLFLLKMQGDSHLHVCVVAVLSQ